MHARTSVLSALSQPRHAASAAADPVAAHRALGGAILSIEGVRTYAHAIRAGAVPVLRAFRSTCPACGPLAARRRVLPRVGATFLPFASSIAL